MVAVCSHIKHSASAACLYAGLTSAHNTSVLLPAGNSFSALGEQNCEICLQITPQTFPTSKQKCCPSSAEALEVHRGRRNSVWRKEFVKYPQLLGSRRRFLCKTDDIYWNMFLLFLAKKSYPLLILMTGKKPPSTEHISREPFLAVLLKLMAKLDSYILNQLLSFIPAVVTTACKCNESGSFVLDEHHVCLTGAPWLFFIFFFWLFYYFL